MKWLLIILLVSTACRNDPTDPGYEYIQGAIVRGDSTQKGIALVFTGDEYADGGEHIRSVLKRQQVPGSFFLTGRFYRNPAFEPLIRALISDGHYLGAHSDMHLLYCDWSKRDSLLVTKEQYTRDLEDNYLEMKRFGVDKTEAPYFLPPYEWYNDSITAWTREMGYQLINYSPGTLSHADYSLPGTPEYRGSDIIFQSIMEYEKQHPSGLNGFILLSHIGTSPERSDKFHLQMEQLITSLKSKGYLFKRIEEHIPL